MRLFVIRHGETDHNVARRIQGPLLDDPLNARGRKQAAALASRFHATYLGTGGAPSRTTDGAAGRPSAGFAAGRDPALGAVYASPLQRAHETAVALARALELPTVAKLDALLEFSWGDYLGRVEDDELRRLMRAIHAEWLRGNLDHAPPNGESPRAAWARAWGGLRPLLARHVEEDPDAAVALVAHGRINKILLAGLVHDDAARMDEFPQGNTSVTLVETDDAALRPGAWRAVYVNRKDHLHDIEALEERADAPGGQGTYI